VRSRIFATWSSESPAAGRRTAHIVKLWRHWLQLAGIARLFTRKSHAALVRACNYLIQNVGRHPSDIFDSYRPLHPQASSGNVGTRHLGQPVDPVGKRWECESIWRLPRSLRYPYVAPVFTRILQQFPRIFCVNPWLVNADGGFLDPQPTPQTTVASGRFLNVQRLGLRLLQHFAGTVYLGDTLDLTEQWRRRSQ
jgi:hypothetical protein